MVVDNNFAFSGYMTSLLELVTKYSVEIPVIQRDYAQGRLSERITEIREKFVKDLIAFSTSSDEISHDLDFVYGVVNKEKNESGEIEERFVPLDGQQRLTTLFLFYLYVAGKSGNFKEFKDKFRGRFIYQTRSSSANFCAKIIDDDVFAEFSADNISDVIKNQYWFFNSWMHDPTIAGMLVMLDSIDKNFKKWGNERAVQQAFENLFRKETSPITFWLLPLNGYTRSDDLYIKMNARGVRLTDLEVFKAKFEDYLKYSDNDNYDCFKRKIDCEWNDFFWPKKFQWNCVDNIDSIIENIIRMTIYFSYRSSSTRDQIKKDLEFLSGKKSMRFTFSQYCEIVKVFHTNEISLDDNRLNNENFIVKNIVDFFDFLCDKQTSPIVNDSSICNVKWFDVKGVVQRALSNYTSLSYTEIVRLYAYLRYCSTHKQSLNIDDLNSWILLIRNLIEASRVDELETTYNSLSSVDDLLKDIDLQNVDDWLAKQDASYNLKHFKKNQFVVECIKAQIKILERSNPEQYIGMGYLINACDAHDYLVGQIGFILMFSGWSEIFKNNTLSKIDVPTYSSLLVESQKYADIIKAIVDGDNCIVDECLVERALLASETTLCVKIENDRLNFYTQRFHRDYSIKNLLSIEPTLEMTDVLTSVKHFLSGLDPVNIVDSLKSKITQINQNTWRYLLFKDQILFKYCSQGFICAKPSELTNPEPNIFLLEESQMNHLHSELYSRDLFERKKNAVLGLRYMTVKSRRDYPGLYFDFKKLDYQYRCLITHKDQTWNAAIYEIHRNDVPQDVLSLLSVLTTGMNGDGVLNALYNKISTEPNCVIVQ